MFFFFFFFFLLINIVISFKLVADLLSSYARVVTEIGGSFYYMIKKTEPLALISKASMFAFWLIKPAKSSRII